MKNERQHVPLWTKVLLIAILNLAVLGIVCAIFLRLQLKPEFESFLMAQARERIVSLATLVTSDLQNTEESQWDRILHKYSNEQGVTVLLYRNTGEQLAGIPTALPPEVDVRMPRGGPPPPPGGGPFPPPFDGRGPSSARSPFSGPGPLVGPPFLAVTKTDLRYWVGVRMPFIQRRDGEVLRSVLMLVSPSFFTNPFFFDMMPWLGISAAAIFISVLCWLPFVLNLTRSIADMMRATAHIAEGRFDVALKPRRHDELGRLGTSINQMAGRLEVFTEGRKRFLGAAAHELRSPIGRMQLAAEILERNANPAGKKYIYDLKEDIRMMSQLTDELLQFAKAESTSEPVKVEPVNLAEAVQMAIRREGAEGIQVRVDVDPSMYVRANTEYLVRSLANVLRNAVRYAGERGPIEVSAHRKNRQIQLNVRDSGPGVPEDSLDKIFTPFYRLDDARDRRTGGTGLGLAIVRTCIEACGGTVQCRNRHPSGLEVIVELPEAGE